MKIKKIRLKNGYKRFHDLTIDLGDSPARIIALIGPNGCGKSSVLDGILYHASAHSTIGTEAHRGKSYHSMNDTNPNYKDVEIELTSGNYEKIHQERQATGNSNTIISFRSPYRYNSSVKIDAVTSVGDIKLNNYGAGDTSSIDQKMEVNYRRLYAKYNRYRDENDLKPSEAKAKIIGELNESIRRCLDLEVYSLGNVEGNQGTIYFKKEDHSKEFEFNVLSSGEKEVLDLLIDLYVRKDEYNETIFLIDEPELHINTAIQGNLLNEIDRLVGPNCQIWLTTHSIGFLRALQTTMRDKCQIIQFRPEYKLAAEPKTLTPVRTNAVAWRDIFSIALDDLAELVCPSIIIYCEGRAEPGPGGKERGLDAQVFNNIFAREYPDSLFTSSGGNTEPDQRSAIAFAILSKVFPKVEIWVLKDRDMASGKPTSESDRKLYLDTNESNHRVLKRWEIENYLFDKEVLIKYCYLNNLEFNEILYTETVKNIYDQDLKSQINIIKNICGIRNSISKDVFKIELSKIVNEKMTVYKELEDCIFKRL